MAIKADITEWQRLEYEKAFDVYCIYMAIKLHFSKAEFNYAEYGPMTNYKFETFYAKEGQRKQFGRLARRFESNQTEVIENYLIANFVLNPKVWVTGLLTRQAQANYESWRKLYENFTYNFTEACETILFPAVKESGQNFMQYLKPSQPGVHTALINDIISKRYPIWFLVALNKVTGFIRAYDNFYKNDIFWENEAFLLRKTDQVVVDSDMTSTREKLRGLIKAHGLD